MTWDSIKILGPLLLLCSLLLTDTSADEPDLDIKLTKANYSAWRDHVLPAKSDLGWQQIPWLTTFQDGLLEADDRELPLLFWTMNGHPLGCT